MTRPCSSACTRCSLPGLWRYAPSCAGTGLCGPELGGWLWYVTGFSVCSRPSIFGDSSLHPAAAAAAFMSVILRAGSEPDGQPPDDPSVPPDLLLDANAIATTATTAAATSTPATM